MEPTSNSNTAAGGLSLLSPALHRVLIALLEGESISDKDRAALTEAEWDELRALARTANLTRLTLHQPDPTPQAQASALAQAQKTLAEVGPRVSHNPASLAPSEPRPTWLERLKSLLRIEEDRD
jgi:hypothetical protein